MVSTSASDKEGARAGALALLDGPNTVVWSSEPVHSPSQSSEAAVGSSSQLSILRQFWLLVLSSPGGPQVSIESGKLGACLFWNVRGPMEVPRPRPPLPLVAAVPLVSLPRRVLSPRPGPSKFSLSRPPRPLPPPRPLNLGGPPPLGRDPLRSRELTRRFSLLLSVSVALPVTGFFFFLVDSCHLPWSSPSSNRSMAAFTSLSQSCRATIASSEVTLVNCITWLIFSWSSFSGSVRELSIIWAMRSCSAVGAILCGTASPPLLLSVVWLSIFCGCKGAVCCCFCVAVLLSLLRSPPLIREPLLPRLPLPPELILTS